MIEIDLSMKDSSTSTTADHSKDIFTSGQDESKKSNKEYSGSNTSGHSKETSQPNEDTDSYRSSNLN